MGILRITSGSLRGRRVVTLEGQRTRPLLTRLRKSLADILRPRLAGARVLDLFAGSGAVAFELLSNGADAAVVVERDPAGAALVRRNAEALGLRVQIFEGDALAAVRWLAARGDTFDVVLVTPPYGLGLQQRTLSALIEHPVMAPGGVLVAQRETKEPGPHASGRLQLVRTRAYGRTVFEFFEERTQATEDPGD